MVDISKIQVGDEVTGRHTVHHVKEGEVYVALADGSFVRLPQDRLLTHMPKPREFKQGQRVFMKGEASVFASWEIRAVVANSAWIKRGNCEIVAVLSELEHAE